MRSCDLYQRCSNKNVGGTAPIQSMPIFSDAFDTVYTDVVGEIIPMSAEDHRYILTMLDSATRFFIAVPMKKIDSECGRGFNGTILYIWKSEINTHGSWIQLKFRTDEAVISFV